MTEQYSISELAKEFEVTTRTLRFYEEKGLLNPGRQGIKRIFSAADRIRLKLILRGKRLGFSLDESSDIIGMYEPETENNRQLEMLLNKIREKRTFLEQQKKEINSMLKDLRNTETICLDALSESSSPIHRVKHRARQ
jgi:DNA-binding transcriptional MerR regulator